MWKNQNANTSSFFPINKFKSLRALSYSACLNIFFATIFDGKISRREMTKVLAWNEVLVWKQLIWALKKKREDDLSIKRSMRLIKNFACSLECNLLLMDQNSLLGHFQRCFRQADVVWLSEIGKNIDGFFKDSIYCEIFKGLDEFLYNAYMYKQIHKKEQSIDCCCVLLW